MNWTIAFLVPLIFSGGYLMLKLLSLSMDYGIKRKMYWKTFIKTPLVIICLLVYIGESIVITVSIDLAVGVTCFCVLYLLIVVGAIGWLVGGLS